jgi:hypothetical protein
VAAWPGRRLDRAQIARGPSCRRQEVLTKGRASGGEGNS